MATRKRPAEPQGALSLFASAPAPRTDVVSPALVVEAAAAAAQEPAPPPPPAEGEGTSSDRPKLRLVYSRPDEDVEIEREPRGGYWVQRRRMNGTIFAGVHYTRGELVALRARIDAALEAG